MKTRTEIINYLIANRGFTRYLEIGLGTKENFQQIQCAYKVGVDPKESGPSILSVTSDDYFAKTTEQFDLVFVDGLHIEVQAARDIQNALAHLRPGGVIVIHDCLPASAECATEEFNGFIWNGTVWRAVLRYFSISPYLCYIYDTDHGCGVIDTAARATSAPTPVEGPLDYNIHFPLLRRFIKR